MKKSNSIATRVSTVVVTAATFGVTASVGLFLFLDYRQAVKNETLRYQSAAYAFAAASSEAALAHDPRKVMEVLRGVRELTDVVYIAARTERGDVLAEIGAGASLVGSGTSMFALPTSVEVDAEIRKAGRKIGSLVLHAEVTGLLNRYLRAFGYSVSLGLSLVFVTSFIARRQIARVVRPLTALSDEFRDIGLRSDLTRRLRKTRNDEVGVLVDAFNEMFRHIDDRDQLLRKHSETLEETVETRTAELRLAKEEADAANEAKSTFLATMSHEIRTPMNGMLVMAEMLAAAPLSPRHLRYADIITRSGKNLLHIINHILDFSKIESGKIELENIEFSLDAIVEDVACLFAERAREKGLSIAVFVAPDVPIRVLGDPVRLTQILSNLVNNGLKFTESGGVKIAVNVLTDPRDGITVVVEDTGIGIEASQIDRIFTRFSQADSSITRRFGGTGLGLSISKQLAELMRGEIRVESTVGLGSKFIVALPLQVVEKAAPFTAIKNLTAAIVDNDKISRNALASALEARGLKVTTDVQDPHDVLILGAADDVASFCGDASVPVLLVRPFAATTRPLPGGHTVIDLPAPISRQMFDQLCRAIEAGMITELDIKAHQSAKPVPIDLSHLRVLAVDDIAVNREVLSEALGTFGIVCDLADSGEAAIRFCRDKAYDIVFMDCSMPGMDGFETVRHIRMVEQNMKAIASRIVALTGYVMGKDSGPWRDAGMDGYLSKPFNITQLTALFQELGIGESPEVASAVANDAGNRSETTPLLSPEALEMFDTIRTATGTDIRSKVFRMFRDNVMQSFDVAKAEIIGMGPDAKKLVHALKSNCSSAGAARATTICQGVEDLLSNFRPVDLALVYDLQSVLADTIHAMNDLEPLGSIGMD
ncbi:ATP-binding protein [Pararhizobium arenae]|uniref:ATP-binding protein n=1 Tax=Pararhizobium arenae TaxID=1856850 RepID=UPI00094AFB3B|nr:ATP-binding protein [Pararhizobium arenae]